MRNVLVLAAVLIAGGAPAALADFTSCVASLRSAAVRAGVDRSIAARALDIAKPDEKILRISRVRPEVNDKIWDYLAYLVDDQRIADGRAMMRKYDKILRAAEKRFGVERHVIAAVWGIETDFGRTTGSYFLPHALATLSCSSGRRAAFWRGELLAALKLVDRGDLKLDKLYGSWAGAFGQTQFMPSTYQRLAVDFDRDGRRDLIDSVADALGSTANYLRRAGWRRGQPWMIEVKVPAGYDGPVGRRGKAPLSTWAGRGVVRADGKPLTGSAQGRPDPAGGAEGAGLPHLPQLRRHLRLQPRRILCARDLPPGRSDGRLSGVPDAVADRRSGPVARPASGVTETPDRPRPRRRRRRWQGRLEDPGGDQEGGGAAGHAADRPRRPQDLSCARRQIGRDRPDLLRPLVLPMLYSAAPAASGKPLSFGLVKGNFITNRIFRY